VRGDAVVDREKGELRTEGMEYIEVDGKTLLISGRKWKGLAAEQNPFMT
jgi:hypothetical protein